MGPPTSTWLHHYPTMKQNIIKPHLISKLIGNPRVLSFNFAFILLIVQIICNLSSVSGAGEVFNMNDYKSACGRRPLEAPQGRIVGGTAASFGSWPWAVSIMLKRKSLNKYVHKCGAVLISDKWVMTVAHGVENFAAGYLLLRMGKTDLANDNEPLRHVSKGVKTIIMHPDYVFQPLKNDIALLRTSSPVKFQNNVMPICLPDNDNDFAGVIATAVGWGRTAEGEPGSDALQQVEIPVLTNEVCQQWFKKINFHKDITKQWVCAGKEEGGVDACEGDSGGPLMRARDSDNRFVLIGISSWGKGCAQPSSPGVYVRISEYRTWINEEISKI